MVSSCTIKHAFEKVGVIRANPRQWVGFTLDEMVIICHSDYFDSDDHYYIHEERKRTSSNGNFTAINKYIKEGGTRFILIKADFKDNGGDYKQASIRRVSSNAFYAEKVIFNLNTSYMKFKITGVFHDNEADC